MFHTPQPDARDRQNLNRLHALHRLSEHPEGLDDHDRRAVREFWRGKQTYDRSRTLTAYAVHSVFPYLDLDALESHGLATQTDDDWRPSVTFHPKFIGYDNQMVPTSNFNHNVNVYVNESSMGQHPLLASFRNVLLSIGEANERGESYVRVKVPGAVDGAGDPCVVFDCRLLASRTQVDGAVETSGHMIRHTQWSSPPVFDPEGGNPYTPDEANASHVTGWVYLRYISSLVGAA